jgi:GT2 family glycosyltransferase
MDSSTVTTRAICILGPPEGETDGLTTLLGRIGVRVAEPGARAAIDDALLARLGGDWQAPPSLPAGWAEAPGLDDLRGQARAVLAAEPGVEAWESAAAAFTLPFWQGLLPGLACLLSVPDPLECARRLEARFGMPVARGRALWLTYTSAALRHAPPDARLLVFPEDLRRDGSAEAERIRHFVAGLADRTAKRPAAPAEPGAPAADGAFPARSLYLALRLARRGDAGPDAAAALGDLAREAAQAEAAAAAKERELAEAVRTAGSIRARLLEQVDELNYLRERVASVEAYWFWAQRNSAAWRLLTRYRYAVDRLLPTGTRRRRLYHLALDGPRVLASEGPRALLRKASEAIQKPRPGFEDELAADPRSLPALSPDQYRAWMRLNRPSAPLLERMRVQAGELGYAPLISVCMPVFNPSEKHLAEAIASLRAQVYENWELIAVDDGSTHPHVRSLLTAAAEADRRIQTVFKETNEGIPRTLNQAFAKARGEFVVVVDHDDIVEPHALFEVARFLNSRGPDWDMIYSDEALVDGDGALFWIAFRPDFSPEFLLSHPYIVHLVAVRRTVLEQVGGCDESFPNVSWDYDLWLRVTSHTRRVGHIPKVLYRWRRYRASASTRDRKLVMNQSKLALARAMKLRGIQAAVEDGYRFNYFRVRPALRGEKVSIIIPSRSPVEVGRCLASLAAKVKYPHLEVVVVANNLETAEARSYFEDLGKQHRVLWYDEPFNYSAINNWAARQTDGAHLLFLNDDTEVIEPESIEAMLEWSQQDQIGAVGAKLLYPNDLIQHAGVIVGFFGSCDHFHKFHAASDEGYLGSLKAIRNFSAVTAACMMVRRAVFDQVGGFDERLRVVFNDVDLCLRIGEAGYRIVYTPYALLYHYEHASRRRTSTSLLPVEDDLRFKDRWRERLLEGDPYYNPNLSRWAHDCRPRFDGP